MFNWSLILIANRPTLYFIYGLSFFLLGGAIILQQRRSSRLRLAQTLPWLSLFALIHGLAEWGYLFIPLNEPYLGAKAVRGMQLVQILMWILSFFFLICFGVAFFQRHRPTRIAFWSLGGFGILVIFVLWLIDHSVSFWLTGNGVEIFARYVLCIPGASLAAVGLLRQREELSQLGSKPLLSYLYLAVISFAGYALAGGLVVPEASFFPASLINVPNFNKLLGFPVELLRAGLGIMMAFSILKVLRMFDLEDQNRIADILKREALTKERERISRDLHDGVIQSIYAVGLTLQKLKKTGSENPQWLTQMDFVLSSLDEAVTDIRKYIQNLSSEVDGKELIGAIDWLESSLSLPVEIKADSSALSRLSPAAANHINLIIKEALTNISKHAQATRAAVYFHAKRDGFEIEIRDNGKGREDTSDCSAEGGKKLGLKNIKARAACLNGNCKVKFSEDGTVIQVWVPWEGNIIAEKGGHIAG